MWASSAGWLKLMAWAAPSIITSTAESFSVLAAISRTTVGGGISGSRSPTTMSVGMRNSSRRSSVG